ncbi:hypothetical protein JYU34_008667, partial [Plutella xylostella]
PVLIIAIEVRKVNFGQPDETSSTAFLGSVARPVSPGSPGRRVARRRREQPVSHGQQAEQLGLELIAVRISLVHVVRQQLDFTLYSKVDPEDAADFYSCHYGKQHFSHLVAHMSSGPIVALVLAAPDAVEKLKELMGPAR